MTLRAAVLSLALATLAVTSCTTTVTGHPAPGEQPSPATRATPPTPLAADDLLLPNRGQTPIGAVTMTAVGTNYYVGAEPPACSAALLFKGSPLRPAQATGTAESAYTFVDTAALYAESVDVYERPLDVSEIVQNGFNAVSGCTVEASGVSLQGRDRPMRLAEVTMPATGVLAWTMTRPDWTCNYGLAVTPQVTLVMSLCDRRPDFDMAGWASTRRQQIEHQSA